MWGQLIVAPIVLMSCYRPKLLSVSFLFGFWVDLDYLFRRPLDGRSPGGQVRESKVYNQSRGPLFLVLCTIPTPPTLTLPKTSSVSVPLPV